MFWASRGTSRCIKSVEEIFALTEEGKKYAQEGLPERNLLSIIGIRQTNGGFEGPIC